MSAHQIDEKSAQEWEESIDRTTAISLASSYVPGSPEEKKLLRKLDFRIIVSESPKLLSLVTHLIIL